MINNKLIEFYLVTGNSRFDQCSFPNILSRNNHESNSLLSEKKRI